MSKCHNCGRAPVSANLRFCQYCGAPAKRTVASPTSTEWAPGPSGPPWRAGKASNRLLITGGAVLGVVVVVTVILIVVLGRANVPEGTTNQTNSGEGQVPTEQPLTLSTTDSAPEFSTDQPTTDPSDNDPATVVQNYYAAINNRDFQTAWQLGGDNLGKPFTTYVNGYASTLSDELSVVDEVGNTVDVDLTAQWNDGTIHQYQGSYVVSNGQIISGTLHRIS